MKKPLLKFGARLRYALLIPGLITISSCCRQHFLKNFDRVRMQSEQLILEARGDTVPFVLKVEVPKGLLCGGMELKITPTLKQDSLKSPFSRYGQKESREDENAFTLTGRKGGSYTFRGYFMNFRQLQNSYFIVEWHAEQKGKSAQLSERLVGYGISQIYHLSPKSFDLKPGFDAALIRDEWLKRGDLNASGYYLLAILSARLYDGAGVRSYLEKAVALDPSIVSKFSNEVEFIAYRKEDWFQAWLK